MPLTTARAGRPHHPGRRLLIALIAGVLAAAALASPSLTPEPVATRSSASAQLLDASDGAGGSGTSSGPGSSGGALGGTSTETGAVQGTAATGGAATGSGEDAGGASGTAAGSHSGTAALSRVAAGLVDVDTITDNAQLLGTGMVLRSDGLVLTNHHVIDHATQVRVRDIGDHRVYRATVAAINTAHDLALLRLQGAANLTVVAFGDSRSVKVGDPITALGNAGGGNSNPIAATGTVTALNQAVDAQGDDGTTEHLTGMIQGNAPAAPGDSGGPMLDSAGVIIGVTTAGSDDSAGNGQQQDATSGASITASPAVVDATPINIARAWIAQASAASTATTTRPTAGQ